MNTNTQNSNTQNTQNSNTQNTQNSNTQNGISTVELGVPKVSKKSR